MKQGLALLAFACVSMQAWTQITLTGIVTDSSDSHPLAGAYVLLDHTPYRTISDDEGRFTFKNLSKGDYLLQVSFVGYSPQNQTIHLAENQIVKVPLNRLSIVSGEVIVSALRAAGNTPTTYTSVSAEELDRQNPLQDLPYLLASEPGVVVTSDAGAGTGYTGMRIRGSDLTRINVTINGIPLNDPESHAVYWVDIPDFAASVNSLQLQRGVGTSTNGAGAFGASMNLETNPVRQEPYARIHAATGSYGTWKTSFEAGTGLLNKHWSFEGRISALGSEGYIDRASSDLRSYFIQGGYTGRKTLLKALAFGGREKTYQAWYGTDALTLAESRTFNWAGAIFEEDGSVSYYDNQTDNYSQDHCQLHLVHRFENQWNLNVSGHYTRGRGYYEEYMQQQPFADYNLQPLQDSMETTDLVRRRWLNNHFWGMTWALQHQRSKVSFLLGGAANRYSPARHFGEVIWAGYAGDSRPPFRYYENESDKSDVNVYAKTTWNPSAMLTLYVDIQYRFVDYSILGLEEEGMAEGLNRKFHFLNPKAGLGIFTNAGMLYASYSIAHREPIRDDYVDAVSGETPDPERLGNLELGLRKSASGLSYALNYFLMHYQNQLVLTGEINADGAYVRRNSGKSYRTGIELTGDFAMGKKFGVGGNLCLSRHRTDYTEPSEQGGLIAYTNKPISFSPAITAATRLTVKPIENIEAEWVFRYVGKQYLDNTGNEDRVLKEYDIHDLNFRLHLATKRLTSFSLRFQVANVWNARYESNGYMWGSTPYYFPQAGRHYMAAIAIDF